MVQMRPSVRDELKKLHKISYSLIKRQSAGVVDVPIGQLSHKDTGRALYVSANAFAELVHKQQIIVKIIHQSQEDIKKVLGNKKLTRAQLIKEIQTIVLDPPDAEDKHSEESSS